MKYFKQAAIITLLCLTGECISAALPVSVPGSIIGLGLLIALLGFKIIKEEQVRETADFLLSNMALFFVPAAVSLLTVFDLISDKAGIILFICVVSTIITFAATAYTVKLVIYIQNKKEGEKNV